MSRRRASGLLHAVCFLLALTPVLASAAPRAGNPCKQIRQDLDRQIDDLKTQQQDELRQCEPSNGKGSAACLNLKEQQLQALRALRDNRTGQMNSCHGSGVAWIATSVPGTCNIANSYYDQANNYYADNDDNPSKRPDPHPRHPHRPPVEASAFVEKQPHGATEHSGKNPHTASVAGGSQGSGSASSVGHSHSGGGSSGGFSSGGHSSGGGSSSYSGGSSSGGSHSSSGGSSNSGGSSYSGGSSSSSSSSSSAGHGPR